MIKRFIIYGAMGICAEIMWNGSIALINGDITMTGRSSIWMFPIYGMLVFVEAVHENIRDKPVIIRGGIYTILIYIGEFTTGSILKFGLGACPWNYELFPLSLYGLITLIYTPVWFVLGLIFELLHDKLIQFGIGYSGVYKIYK